MKHSWMDDNITQLGLNLKLNVCERMQRPLLRRKNRRYGCQCKRENSKRQREAIYRQPVYSICPTFTLMIRIAYETLTQFQRLCVLQQLCENCKYSLQVFVPYL
ncbi:Hypothetical_protein [Hexamita inflata]|uniref:Hypothetical_protein n=1 Tax=Hexamita inflata TaxID=28002 RepID=A0AA86TPV1_9EUKA|nr:Hypothetical protein HINF_LOCUS12749 [Hexamita inflata]